MDEFLKEINTSIFKEWLLLQKSPHYQIHLHKQHSNIIVIETDYSYSEITFNELCIIELNVTNTVTKEVEFYLHFQMKTMKHAIELFHEMLECIKKLVNRPITKILLSCSGGLTTSFFASKMNEAAKLLYLNYEADATSYTYLFDVGNDFDIILLAPQISYMHTKVQDILKDKIVISIPPQVFAKYDVGKMLAIIREARQKQNDKPAIKKITSIPARANIHCTIKILCLSIFRNSNRVHIAYRLYAPGNRILLDNEIIKNKISLRDMFDVIDTVLLNHPDVETIGISIPGIINDGFVVSASITGMSDFDLKEAMTSRYRQKFYFGNDVNTAAVGYYASQTQYSSLSFLFQPTNFLSGVGSIFNGQLITGQYNLAGEVQYLPIELSDTRLNLMKTPEGALELVAKTIVSIVCITSPQVIVLCCTLIPQVSDLKKEIQKYLPKKYIPHIMKVENLQEYTLLGEMLLCLQEQNG